MAPLRMVIADYGHTIALKNGGLEITSADVEVVDVNPIIAAYRRMVRNLEYDIAELSPTTYLLAREFGVPFTALPLFINRRFHHGDIQCAAHSGIRLPKELAGRRVGIRAYTVTTALWVRAILAHEYQVDLSTITWYTDDEEHVTQYRPPANVVAVERGETLVGLLSSGKIDAALGGRAGVGRAGPPTEGWLDKGIEMSSASPADEEPYSLIAHPGPLDQKAYRDTGVYPMHSIIVMRDDLITAQPKLVAELYELFSMAKDDYIGNLSPETARTEEDWRFLRQGGIVGGDPLPYGMNENYATLRALIDFAQEQGIITKPVDLQQLFVPGVGGN